jgi:hypothetical protein
MTRRLTLVGVFVMIEQGSMMQLIIGTAFSACYMLLQMQVDPYAETSSDFLANGCSFALLVFFLCCIAFKVQPSAHLAMYPIAINTAGASLCASASASAACGFANSFTWGSERIHVPPVCALQVGTLTELNAVRAVMTKEQKRDFRNSTLALSVGLFASVAFALVASFAILLVQLRHERKRIESEARSAKARRLRYKADKNEVTVPSIMQGVPKHFHTFLSHVWGYGGGVMNVASLWAALIASVLGALGTGLAKTRCASSSNALRRCSHIWKSSSTCAAAACTTPLMMYPSLSVCTCLDVAGR